MKTVTSILALSALLATTAAGFAGSATGNLTVKVTIESGCVVNANAGEGVPGGTAVLDFGSTPLLTTNLDRQTAVSGAGAIQVLCTKGTKYAIKLDGGLNSNKDVTARKMKGTGTETIGYQLYQDAARTKVWGTAEGEFVSADATGDNVSYQVFGRVPAQATTPAPGTYSDTVGILLTY